MNKKFIKQPLNGITVADSAVGVRTPNILMGEHAGEYVRGDIMDANAVIQAFDELRGNVDNDHDSLQEIVDELHNLRDATDQGFEAFQEKAEEETANRVKGDKTLEDKINTEINRATTKENEMETTFTAEINKKANSTELATLQSKVAELEQRIATLESKQAE